MIKFLGHKFDSQAHSLSIKVVRIDIELGNALRHAKFVHLVLSDIGHHTVQLVSTCLFLLFFSV